LVKLDTDEIIKVRAGKLSRNYKAYKGTFFTMVYNCMEKKALPGFYFEETLVLGAEQKDKTLWVTISGSRCSGDLMDIMDIALRNSSAFPSGGGKAQFTINVK